MATIIHSPYGAANSTITCSGNGNVAYVNGSISSGWKDESADIKEFVEFADPDRIA